MTWLLHSIHEVSLKLLTKYVSYTEISKLIVLVIDRVARQPY